MERLDIVGLLKAFQQLERDVSVSLMYSGLRIPQFRLLELLDEAEQATVTEMSKKLSVSRATASVMINELIKAGIVGVVENPSDRRSFHIRLTEIGRNKLNVARSDVSVLRNNISGKHSEETIRTLNEFAKSTIERSRHRDR